MLNKLFSFLPKHCALTMMKELLEELETVLGYFEHDYQKDGNVRNAAIDALIELLTSLKSKEESEKENNSPVVSISK